MNTSKGPRGVSFSAIIIGLALGLGIGLYYAWAVNPVVSTDVAPWQLARSGQNNWMIAVAVAWAQDHDLIQAANRLNDLRLNEATFQRMADLACELARSSYAQSETGQTAIRALVNLSQGQGKQSCASELIVLNTNTPVPSPTPLTATPTPAPPSTKTTTPELVLSSTATLPAPTVVGTGSGVFRVVRIDPFCSVNESGLLEVYVQEPGAVGIPGMAVQVDWASGRDRFFTGLKPERDPGYADFRMTSGETYTVTLPGLGDRTEELTAQPCNDRKNGGSAVTSFRVYFRRLPR